MHHRQPQVLERPNRNSPFRMGCLVRKHLYPSLRAVCKRYGTQAALESHGIAGARSVSNLRFLCGNSSPLEFELHPSSLSPLESLSSAFCPSSAGMCHDMATNGRAKANCEAHNSNTLQNTTTHCQTVREPRARKKSPHATIQINQPQPLTGIKMQTIYAA